MTVFLFLSCLELQSVTPLDLPNSVITLLQGAGLLQNLTQIAEQTRSEDEHVLTDKLEMVKGTLLLNVCLSQCGAMARVQYGSEYFAAYCTAYSIFFICSYVTQ